MICIRKRKQLRSFFLFFTSVLITGIILISCSNVQGREPEFDRIDSLPQSENLLLFDTRFSSGLFVKELSYSQVFSWNPNEEICSGAYSWSEKHQTFSFWGGPCETRSKWLLYSLSLDNTLETLQAEKPYSWKFEHTWSPDGSEIAFPDLSYNPYNLYLSDVFLQTYGQQDYQQITNLPKGSVSDLTWSPDGNSIIFVYIPHEARQSDLLYKIGRQGQDLILLSTEIEGQFSSPQWSPDGSAIAFMSRGKVNEPKSLWITDADGSNPTVVFAPDKNEEIGGGVSSIAWSPNSNEIAFTSNHQGPCKRFFAQELERIEEYTQCGHETYITNLDGTDVRKVTDVISYGPIFNLFWINTEVDNIDGTT